MNKKTVFVMLGVVGLSLLLAGCAGLFQNPVPEAEAISPGAPDDPETVDPRLLGEAVIEGEYIPDRIVVGYEDNPTGKAAFAKVLALVGEGVLASVDLGNIIIASIDLKPDLDVPEALGLVILLITGKLEGDTRKGRLEGIVFAEPDYDIPPPGPIPEPEVGVSSLDPKVDDPNADLRPFQWALDAINADAAWAHATGAGIIVAVMDTGVDGTHPDLVGQLVDGYEVRWGTILPAGSNSDVDFLFGGHGTHCAGIIAAKNDNRGVVGLAYNAKIMPIRIFDIYLVPFPHLRFVGAVQYARGVVWAVTNGAKVLSNSWGGAAYSQAIKAAVDYALAHGVVHVNSSGNDTYALWTRPASIPGVIGVAASDPHNKKARFSTPGTWVSVAAPGVKVLSSVRSQTIQPGTGLPLLYDYWDGTSMSCPYVSALAAMILEKYPAATPYQIKALIAGTAKDIEAPGFDTGTGHGLIQADKALTTALPPNNGAALRIHVVTASSWELWGAWWPTIFMDLTLRKDGRIVGVGQTDAEGNYYIGFPVGDYWPGWGLGYFPILEPGTYEIIVGGDDCRLSNYRTANRVTTRTTVTLAAGETRTVDVYVNTTLKVTMSWTGGGPATDIDLAVEEPYIGPGGTPLWTSVKAPGPWGTWSPDASGPSGTETYTLNPIHGDDALYRLAVRLITGPGATVTVTIEQNTIVETYRFTVTAPGWYYAYDAGPPVTRWPGWWDTYGGPWVY